MTTDESILRYTMHLRGGEIQTVPDKSETEWHACRLIMIVDAWSPMDDWSEQR